MGAMANKKKAAKKQAGGAKAKKPATTKTVVKAKTAAKSKVTKTKAKNVARAKPAKAKVAKAKPAKTKPALAPSAKAQSAAPKKPTPARAKASPPRAEPRTGKEKPAPRSTTTLVQTVEVAAAPSDVYAAYLDSAKHAKFTGGGAKIDARVGGRFSAWDGYITGTTLELTPGRRIVQAWRTSEWPEGFDDSRLELTLAKSPRGTKITMVHENVPSAQAAAYEAGWVEHYWEPLRRFFGDDVAEEAGDLEDLADLDDADTTDEFEETDLGGLSGDDDEADDAGDVDDDTSL
jgi:uncharacterized protein YndB with AHSA1/START domain